MNLGTRREPALVLVLILLSCGIYYLYFIYKTSQEISEFLGEADYSPGTEVLLSVLTCGLWNVYWDYRTGKRIARMSMHVGLPPTDNALLYLILDLLGVGGFASLGIINPVLQQEGLNQVWQAAMTGPQDGDSWPPPPSPTPAPAPAAAGVRRESLGVFTGLAALLLASVLLPMPGQDGHIGHVPAFCPFYRLTGLPCPGCGLTRSFVCLGHGHWAASLHWHPIGWLVYGLCGLLWLRAGVTLARGVPCLPLSPPLRGRLSLAGAVGLLLVGAARIVWLTVHHQTF